MTTRDERAQALKRAKRHARDGERALASGRIDEADRQCNLAAFFLSLARGKS